MRPSGRSRLRQGFSGAGFPDAGFSATGFSDTGVLVPAG